MAAVASHLFHEIGRSPAVIHEPSPNAICGMMPAAPAGESMSFHPTNPETDPNGWQWTPPPTHPSFPLPVGWSPQPPNVGPQPYTTWSPQGQMPQPRALTP